MKTKNSNQLILGLLGISLVLLTYQFIYLKYLNETARLESNTRATQMNINFLKQQKQKESYYLTDIDRMNLEMDLFLGSFSSDIKTEDEILFVKDMEEKIANLKISSILVGVAEAVTIQSNAEENKTENESDMTDNSPTLYKVPLSLSYTTDADGLKEMIQYIYSGKEGIAIDSITINSDPTTGRLSGTATIIRYMLK